MTSAGHTNFKNCQLAKLGTTAVHRHAFRLKRILLDNTTFKFGSTGDGIRAAMRGGLAEHCQRDCRRDFANNFIHRAEHSGRFRYLEAVDLSALGSGKTLVAAARQSLSVLKDCKLGASVTVADAHQAASGETIVSRADSSGTNYIEQKYSYAGTQTDETVIIRTSGASDGTTAKSRKIVTTANSKWQFPFEATPIAIWQDSTSAATATLEGVWNAAALPNNDDIWFDLEYLGAAGNPQGSFATGTKADGLASGSALTASTQAWDTLVTARANTTAYSLGDVHQGRNQSRADILLHDRRNDSGKRAGGICERG
jgi:hypothetical protein